MLAVLLISAWSFDLDIGGTYSYSGRHGGGAAVEPAAALPVWHTNDADGWLRGGAMVGYQAEPPAHRLEAWIFVEHRFRLLPARQLHFGVGLFGGLTELFSAPDQPVFAMGAFLTLGVQVHERVAIIAKGFVPFPYTSPAVSTYVVAILGASFTLAAF